MMINGSSGLEMRADDVDVTGDAYRSVRIEGAETSVEGHGLGWFYRSPEKGPADPVAGPRGSGLGGRRAEAVGNL